ALAALIWRMRRKAKALAVSLPGDWAGLIEPPLRRFMASGALSPGRALVLLPVSIWALLVLALARPALDVGAASDYSNLAGRVIVFDLGAGADIHSQRLAANRLMEASPGVPTGIVVGTVDAFDVVPLTTDRAYVDRYVQVIAPDVMPLDGQSVRVAIAHGEAVLTRAGIVAGQVVLLTAGAPPDQSASKPRWRRAILVAEEERDAWADYASASGARLASLNDANGVLRDLQSDIDRARRDSAQRGRTELAPYLIAAAMLGWLALFRRRRTG
ncbi:MAG: hypothetical protein ACR2RL_18540, partial [Gammaproteobacteria bacterium]